MPTPTIQTCNHHVRANITADKSLHNSIVGHTLDDKSTPPLSERITMVKADIIDRHDLEILLRHFYQDVLADPIIGFYFNDVIPFSLEHHLPRVIDFWAQLLFGETSYHGALFERHQDIHHQAQLSQHHFHRWLHILNNNIDLLFAGPNCLVMKTRAARIAGSMATALAQKPSSNTALNGVQRFDPN